MVCKYFFDQSYHSPLDRWLINTSGYFFVRSHQSIKAIVTVQGIAGNFSGWVNRLHLVWKSLTEANKN
jgi:hypothetical protein